MQDLTERFTPKPDAEQLLKDWERCVEAKDTTAVEREKLNINARACWWEGQSNDGRKWYKRQGEANVFPWKGASDSRPHLVDTFTNEDHALLMQAWRRANIQALPTEASDTSDAGRMTTLLRWQKTEQIAEAEQEARLAANYFLERGKVVISTIWVKQRALAREVVEMETLRELAMEAQQLLAAGKPDLYKGVTNLQLAELELIVMDPTREEEAKTIASTLFPNATTASIANCIKSLRSDGVGELVVSYLKRNRPVWTALALGSDVYLPPGAQTIDDKLSSIHILCRESETSLLDMQESMGLDPGWVKQVIATQRGVYTESQIKQTTNQAYKNQQKIDTDSPDEMFELIYTYRRLHDKDGVPGIYLTVWSKGLANRAKKESSIQWFGSHSLVNYDHGEYPFRLITRESRVRNAFESRGYGEIANTWQQGVKSEWDGRRDRNSLATVPPSHHPPSEPPYQWGPGVQIGTTMPEMYGFFNGPNYDPGSKELEITIMHHADRYFGRRIESGVNAIHGPAMNQEMVSVWLQGWKDVFTQTLQLDQQFMPDEVFARVIGDAKSQPIKITRDQIQGKFNVQVHFNTDTMDPERVDRRNKMLAESLKIDRDAAVDTTELIKIMYETEDTNLASRLLRTVEQSKDAEVKDEQTVWSKMWAGVPVDVEIGQNYQLRLQWLKQILENSPRAQQQYQQDEQFRELVDRRMKQLSFQIQQYGENARIGRTGA